MTNVFLERSFDPALSADKVSRLAAKSQTCFDLHRVHWHRSLLSLDGSRLVCWFTGLDAESVRIALRQVNTDMRKVWLGTVHDAPGRGEADIATANVLVGRRFAEATDIEAIQAIEDEGAWCLEAHNVEFMRTYFSRDRLRMICLYRAPDAESVRLAQRQAGLPVDEVWPFTPINP